MRTSRKTERPRLMRLRRLQRQSRSQRRRRLRQSSISPVHLFFFFFPSQSVPLLPPSPHPSLFPSLFLSFFLSSLFSSRFRTLDGPLSLHKPSPEEYFYQQFCKYWFRFLAQNEKAGGGGGGSDRVLLSRPNMSYVLSLVWSLIEYFSFNLCFYFVFNGQSCILRRLSCVAGCVCVCVCVSVSVC